MRTAWPKSLAAAFERAQREPLTPPTARQPRRAVLEVDGLRALLPHRGVCMLLDKVSFVDLGSGTIAATYDLGRAVDIFAGHFPGRPVYPGVLQIEAIAQAGALVRRLGTPLSDVGELMMTDVLRARFIRPVPPGREAEITARVFEDGLFSIVLGQYVVSGEICCVAAIRGLL